MWKSYTFVDVQIYETSNSLNSCLLYVFYVNLGYKTCFILSVQCIQIHWSSILSLSVNQGQTQYEFGDNMHHFWDISQRDNSVKILTIWP